MSSQLILVLGSGGVGKTSTSAALGLALAERGFRCSVITIDPAKRLAQALGLESLSNEAQRVQTHDSGGSLDALWLDSSKAIVNVVERYIHDEKVSQSIINNRLFKIIQEQLGGIEEYLSVDKLLQLKKSEKYDFCILDTPPSRHALDFIESPKHLLKFFDEGILKVFLAEESDKPKGFVSRLFSSSKSQALEIFKKFLGARFMSDFGALLAEIRPINESIRATAMETERWVREPNTLGVLVTIPELYPTEEAYLLSKELLAHQMHKAKLLILNRCLPASAPMNSEKMERSIGKDLLEHLSQQQKHQQKIIESIENRLSDYAENLVRLPRFSNSHIDRTLLLNLGKDLISQWENQNPNIFSKN